MGRDERMSVGGPSVCLPLGASSASGACSCVGSRVDERGVDVARGDGGVEDVERGGERMVARERDAEAGAGTWTGGSELDGTEQSRAGLDRAEYE